MGLQANIHELSARVDQSLKGLERAIDEVRLKNQNYICKMIFQVKKHYYNYILYLIMIGNMFYVYVRLKKKEKDSSR